MSASNGAAQPHVLAHESQRERAKRDRIERIVRAARELLNERPSNELSIPRVAERAGVAPMTIFNLIGTRDDLWAALADDALGGWHAASESVADPHERARSIIDEVTKVITRDAPVFRALISEWRESGRMLEQEPSRALVECLRQGTAEGSIRPDSDARRLASAILSGLIGIVHQWAAGMISARAVHQRARDLVDIVFAAARSDSSELWKTPRAR